DADHAGAEARRELDERAQIAEIADAPVALRAHPVKLDHEAPEAAALREPLRLVARAFLHQDLFLGTARAERALQRAPGLGVEPVFALPDVEVARRNLAHAKDSIRHRPPFPALLRGGRRHG